jgi:hypothetical protein
MNMKFIILFLVSASIASVYCDNVIRGFHLMGGGACQDSKFSNKYPVSLVRTSLIQMKNEKEKYDDIRTVATVWYTYIKRVTEQIKIIFFISDP